MKTTNLFEMEDYKLYTQQRLEALPKRGYGQLKKLAEHMRVSSTFVSQVFHGKKSLSLEQGVAVCEFLGLSERERDYFLKLISLERAGTEKLRTILLAEIHKSREQSQTISSRLDVKKVLPAEESARFYSEWHYSAVRLLIGIRGFREPEAIAQYLGLNLSTVHDTLQFLLKTGLILRDERQRLRVGPSRTHLEAGSPFIKMHHSNWRLKALEQVRSPNPHKLHYSAPMTVGPKEVALIRARLVQLIEEVGKIVDPAPNEELVCLNIDWFKVEAKQS